MGSVCGKSSSKVVEPEANPEDLLRSGDLVLMRLAAQDKDGLSIPVDIMSELNTATLGDQVSQRRKKLPSWDRAGVVMIRTRNGIDTVNVVMAGQTKVEVYKIQELMKDPMIGVIGVRELSPKYDPELENASLADMIDSGAQAITPLDRAIMEIAHVEYDELVRTTKDDSLLEVFDRCQRWCMEKVQTGSIEEYRKQMTKTKKKRIETAFQKKQRKKANGGKDVPLEELNIEGMSNLDLKALLTTHKIKYEEAVEEENPREVLLELIRSHKLHIKNNPDGDLEGSDEEADKEDQPDAAAASPWKGRKRGFKAAVKAAAAVTGLQQRRMPSDHEWAQLLTQALGRELSPEQAFRIQGQMQIEMNLTAQQVEELILLMCGRRDMCNHLSAEMALHVYRRMDIVNTSSQQLASASKLSGEDQDLLNDEWCVHHSFSGVKIIKHLFKENRDLAGRVTQRFESFGEAIAGIFSGDDDKK